MKTFLLTTEFISGILLVITILMHSPKGEGLGSIGGQAQVFNYTKGIESGLNKITSFLGFVFFISAAILGIIIT
ncbi:preprotein translocase subunit SecG [bacterium]|jgi:preprotein translocase subunit SecG|nr:preprotein translocase subunit SecG [bacterium]MBT3580897.1 preprotein translocase subunit SecG [bacterium]MBT4551457.1 preprotein translocase subunit SecG [bacterium]